jgi:hypothetical protein
MSIDNETCQLNFPLEHEPAMARTYVVNDFEVLGVGALRRHFLLDLKRKSRLILQRHPQLIVDRELYELQLQETLRWLAPEKIIENNNFDESRELERIYSAIFPLTKTSLGDSGPRIFKEYLRDMAGSALLLQDVFRYFPGFLRRRFPEQVGIYTNGQWEWARAALEYQDFSVGKNEEGRPVRLNPSLQIIARLEGLTVLVYSEAQQEILERVLDIFEAHIIDILESGDRKFSSYQQLQEYLPVSDEAPTEEGLHWGAKIEALKKAQIIL